MSSFSGITHLTFDCYGTLIDWETGILRAVEPVLARHGGNVLPEALLRSYMAHEARVEAGPWRRYREVLASVMDGIAKDIGLKLTEAEKVTLAESLPDWPPFADTVEALRRLKTRFKLVIVSNTDDDLFAGTAGRLEVPFDAVITAEQVRSYKPAEAHFHEVLRRLQVSPIQVLHVAQSLYHDHVPARRLGFRTAHINRPSRLHGTGLAPNVDVIADHTAPDLRRLLELIRQV